VGGSVSNSNRSPTMHPVILQAYANAVAADRRSRRRPQPEIRAAVRRVRA